MHLHPLMCIYRFYYFIKILTKSDKSLFNSLSYRWKSLQLIQVFLSSTENNKGTYWRAAGAIIYTPVSSSAKIPTVHCVQCFLWIWHFSPGGNTSHVAKFVMFPDGSWWTVSLKLIPASDLCRLFTHCPVDPGAAALQPPPPYPPKPLTSHPRQPLPHCLTTSLPHFSPQVRLTPSALFSPPGAIPIAAYLCVRVHVCVCVECDARVESLWRVERREEGLQKQINTWIPREKIHPCCWSYFTQDREGAEKFIEDKSVAWRQGCRDQKHKRSGINVYSQQPLTPHVSSAC